MEQQNFYNEQHMRWRSQLETKSNEMELLKKRFDREAKELECMKLKLVEELEIRQRLERDIADSDKYRNMYNELRRAYEVTKSEHAQQVENLQKLMKELKIEKDSTIAELQFKLQEQRKVISTHKHEETIRSLERENEELNVKVKQLLNELNEVREEKSQLVAQKEQASILQSQQYAQLLTNCRSMESDNERYKKKIERLNEQIEDSTQQNDRMHESILKFEKENIHLHYQLEEQMQSFNSERSALKTNFEEIERESEREQQNLKNQIAELCKRVEYLKSQKQKLLTRLSESKRNKENLSKNIRSLKERLSNYIKKSKKILSKYKEQKTKLKQLVEQLKLAYSKEKEQSELMSQQISKYEDTISQLQSELWQEKRTI